MYIISFPACQSLSHEVFGDAEQAAAAVAAQGRQAAARSVRAKATDALLRQRGLDAAACARGVRGGGCGGRAAIDPVLPRNASGTRGSIPNVTLCLMLLRREWKSRCSENQGA